MGDVVVTNCTCKPPTQPYHHEYAVTTMGNKYAVRIDQFDDDSEIDPACPLHGEHGSMVVKIYARSNIRPSEGDHATE